MKIIEVIPTASAMSASFMIDLFGRLRISLNFVDLGPWSITVMWKQKGFMKMKTILRLGSK